MTVAFGSSVLLAAVLAAGGSLVTGTYRPEPSEAATPGTVVVAELFTSEGCSSCPPADAVLTTLAGDRTGAVTVLALGEHVDYWDRLGWRDPFSSELFSRRQSDYAASVFRSGNIYTPQLVVDGQFEVIGSDLPAVRAAIAKAARSPKASVVVQPTSILGAGEMRVSVRADVPTAVNMRGTADLVVAIVEDRLVTQVRGGENGGRTLPHTAVVRILKVAGELGEGERSLTAAVSVPWSAEWKRGNVRVVSFLQERSSRHILGAGSALID